MSLVICMALSQGAGHESLIYLLPTKCLSITPEVAGKALVAFQLFRTGSPHYCEVSLGLCIVLSFRKHYEIEDFPLPDS